MQDKNNQSLHSFPAPDIRWISDFPYKYDTPYSYKQNPIWNNHFVEILDKPLDFDSH